MLETLIFLIVVCFAAIYILRKKVAKLDEQQNEIMNRINRKSNE